MIFDDFLSNFSAQFKKTDKALFSYDTVFWDLEEWSSLTAISVIFMIEEKYNISFSSTDLKSSRTIGELYQRVCLKNNQSSC